MAGKCKKTRWSISRQFTLIFASLMIGTIAFFLLINTTFLKEFYIRNKFKAIKMAYQSVETATVNSALDSEEFDKELNNSVLRYNIDIIVVDVDSQTVKYKGKDLEAMKLAIWDRIFAGGNNENEEIIEQTDKYRLSITTDPRTGIEYIEMWGFLSDENIFLMRSAIQSLEESARITNRFLSGVGAVAIVLGIIITLLLSRKVSKPILELADISDRMRRLDFEAKYTGKQKNEIGLLGDNINKMSQALENTISELKVANVKLMQDIEKKEKLEEMRSEFLSNVSHELKTPISIIQGYAEGLAEGISQDAESREYYCGVILDEANKMSTMVKRLLTLNELEFGEDNVNMERFDIVTMIRNRLQAAELIIKQNDINIIFNENMPIYVWGDEFRAEEVFTNYLSNAITHCSGEKKIEIKLECNTPDVRIWVSNTGENIPEESLGHLFEKFYKIDKARTRDYGGSGIGLSIVKAIQDSIGKQCGVKNLENGVSFWFDMEQAQI
ncbi:MAG: HAMP domain-containing histidine kinase [Lachnospiraceae bacterium]|nr:HAMP domain-containing histidine kinase [Lachnospiraceae bacterium]